MARGIEALLRQQEQMGPKADRPETVKPGITDLPRLPEYQPMTGSIDLLNWLTHIQPIMEDLSDTSYAWWEGTLQDAAAWYTSYSAASPLERLRLKPLSSEGLHRPEWARVERRATAMMLSAVPPQVREEVIAMGNVSSLALLCKLYAVYQPGNLQEKSLVLQKLERPDECDTALQAVEALRKWTLWRRRASSIGIAEPDASVLIQGLDRITTKVVKANSELSFRVSLIRSTLQLDVCPSLQSVTSFHQHLQAEMEQQARLSVTQGPGGHAQRKVEFAEGEGEIRAKVLQVLSEVQHLPMVKSLMDKIREWMSTASPSSASRRLALLDSGATHVLRAPTTSAEWELAREVKVQLAGDSVMAMKQNEAGSLLTGDQLAQVIVPLGKVIQDLGYRLLWTSEVCELVGPQGDVLPLTIRNGCPEVSEKVAYRLIQQLEAQQLPELEGVTQASISAIAKLKSSWWSYLKEYVKTGDVTEAHRAVDKAPFFDYKDVIKEQMITRTPREGIWNLMKGLRVNRRARKRLLRASSWIVRWDVPAIDKAVDPMKHLMFVGDMVYVNLNTMLIENEFADLWKVVQWAAFNGRIGVVVANDGPARPLEQVVARPHRSKVHFLHALATAAREVHGGEVVRLYIEDLERFHKVSSGAEDPAMAVWPPWTLCKESRSYYEEMGLSDVSIGRTADTGAWRIAKLSGDAAWRLHVARNHQPFRRDCSVCVRNSAAGHQHRATAHPMAYTLSVDVVGPLKGFGRSPDGKFFKYFVIGAMRIPKVEGADGHGEVRGFPVPPPEAEDDDCLLEDDDGPDEGGELEPGGVDPSEVEREEQRWKDLMSSFKAPILTTTLYFAIPVNNKKAATMLPAVQRMVTDVKALGYPITRIHSDRGGEFRGNLVRKWALSQGMWPTTTSGSDSAANGVAESGVRYLKRRARVLLDSAGLSKEHWPTAVQYAAAQQRCEQLGTLPMMPVAYGAKVYVKTKRYKTGAVEDFGPHWTRGRYAGPSTDIRGGHVIIKDTGTFIQTTHVRVTKDPPPLEEVTPTIVVEPQADDEGLHEEPPLPPPVLPPPPRRMRTKTTALSKVDGGYPRSEILCGVPDDKGLGEEEERGLKYLRVGEIQYVEAIAKQLYQDAKYTEDDAARLLSLFAGTCGNLKVSRAPKGKGLIVGAYVHGGAFGLTRYGRDLPWVARYFNSYLSQKICDRWPSMKCSWTTLAIQAASEVPKHRDNHNERGTYNYVVELKTNSLEGLWVQNRDDERQVVGGSGAQNYQYEEQDGKTYEGCLLNVKNDPAVFDPLIPHAYVKGDGEKWFLSAYTPQGAYKLSVHDLTYLEDVGFPLRPPGEEQAIPDGALETTPVLKTASLLSGTSLSGAHGKDDEVEAVTVGDCEATLWDWAMYVEEESEPPGDGADLGAGKLLRRVCASDDPGVELGTLTKTPELLNEEELEAPSLLDMEENVEYWSSLGLYDLPRMAKMEPEYVEGIESIIAQAVQTGTPLRHTYNVSPQEAKAVIEQWRPAILKELGVVERGFKRVTSSDVARMRGTTTVQELPSKLVYTVKPPSGDEQDDERAYCKRKARIVCCGNFAAEDQSELYAGGAAAESLRCALAYTARRKWRSGITDITGAFMLTPLPTGVGQVVYIIRPPMALVQLGLADPQERWQLTHGMYGLRQSPKLWSSFRDNELKKMVVECQGKVWRLQQGTAEPNMWLVREKDAPPDQEPDGLVLVYVDDILISGPSWLVQALSTTIRGVWKASPLEMLEVNHDIRFLGCEIAVTEDYDAIYLHQRPYIEEILRQYATPETEQSPIQAPKEWVSFEAREGEDCGTEDQIRQAQKACGELLWIAQRSRPDLSFVVCAMGSLLTRAAPRCLSIAARLRSYLQRTKGLALSLKPTNDQLIVYSDSSFAPEGSKSHSGFVAVWLGAPVCWRSARQPFTCLSTAECELLAATEGLIMGKSIESVLAQLMPKVGAIHLKVDNQAAISLAKPFSSSSWRTRHLRVRASYIHEQVMDENVTVTFVPGKNQWADLLTKSFPRQRLEELIKLWGFVDTAIETSKIAVVRALVACMMVQTARAQEETPLALTMSFELYVMVALLVIAAVAVWELLWWCVDRCCGEASHTAKNDEFYKGEGIYRIAASRESMEGLLTYGYVCGILFRHTAYQEDTRLVSILMPDHYYAIRQDLRMP
ncbi:Copia protein [Symbiodinium microadriaticum]|uniref:Copia protein n=1 Tax=Symbiodinium microadriaticum TaxID=2951 RepID=A0A1Q9DFD0_SYMMI|nr:Copia protein [Symbiodinium microadriaticum]